LLRIVTYGLALSVIGIMKSGGLIMTDMLRYKWTSFGPMLDEDGPFVLLVDAEAAIDALRKDSDD
jgi:hypothetical protein